MARDYRQIYEKILQVKLKNDGATSIHHQDWNHRNSKIENMVAIPSRLHEEYNIVFRSFPKLIRKLQKDHYIVLYDKVITGLIQCLSVYRELNYWIQVKKDIMHYGIEYVKKNDPKVKDVYV